MTAEGSGVPAGWYPDPLGLPQLRWWDGGAWTEFTSAAEAEALHGEDDASPRVIDLDEDLAGGAADLGAVPAEEVGAAPAEDIGAVSVDGSGDDDDDAEATVVVPPGESFSLLVESGPEAGSEPEPELRPAPAPEPESGPELEQDSAPEASVIPDPPPQPAEEPGAALAVVPEPFVPAQADPFAAAEANALIFTSRRARREYERKLELESGLPDRGEQSYSQLDTNPIDIQLAGPGVATAAAASAGGTADAAAVELGPQFAVPQSADPGAPTAGTPLDGREDLLAQSTLAPQRDEAAVDAPRFSFESTAVAEELPPARTLLEKRTYGVAAYLLAMLPPLAVLGLIALRFLPGLTATSELAWAVCAGAFLIGVLLAFLDAGALRRWGHERTASPLWALLTPPVYLSVRSVVTRRETGYGRAMVLAWILGLVLAALLCYLFPDAIALLVPGFVPSWTSIIG